MRRLLAVAAIGAALLLAGFGGPANFGREGAGFGRPNVKGGGGGSVCSNTLNFTQSCNLRLTFFSLNL